MPIGAKRWELLADAATGRLATSWPADRLIVCESATADTEVLSFHGPIRLGPRPPAYMLERFLAANTDERLLGFARRFGPLVRPDFLTGEGHREPLRAWRQLRWQFDYLLGLCVGLREGEDFADDPFAQFISQGIDVRPSEDRLMTLADLSGESLQWPDRSRSRKRQLVAVLVEERAQFWIEASAVRPALEFDPRANRFDLVFRDGRVSGTSVLGSLALQFLSAATSTGFAVCSSCGGVFVPKGRRPPHGRRRYCLECGNDAAVRDAKAAYRARERERERRRQERREARKGRGR